ncbi:hypothetical protein SteCoe_21804 [Stentor coeruleus]|uniref:Uncharacterized protein n=1 Tax=Stentor coeruleus TaxID=5963 RepID=A0A1R2BNU2_9CILI|nr:hypothetical protein SteCoe_21804 [Stentor coeruleus]
MVDGNRNTACFKPIVIENNQNSDFLQPIPSKPHYNNVGTSEVFDFSFKEEVKKKYNDNPSSSQEFPSKIMPITHELSSMHNQIEALNSKILHNLTVLKEKQALNQELKLKLLNREPKSNSITDASFADAKCSCNQGCLLL